MTHYSLTPNPNVFLKIIKIHKADKEVPVLKTSRVSERKRYVVTHIIKVNGSDKEAKVPAKIYQVYLEKVWMIL